jgi:hypothetical protein
MERDKKIFLIEKSCYRKEVVANLTEKELEEWVAEEEYLDNPTIIKVDANSYANEEEALEAQIPFLSEDDYYFFSFGF